VGTYQETAKVLSLPFFVQARATFFRLGDPSPPNVSVTVPRVYLVSAVCSDPRINPPFFAMSVLLEVVAFFRTRQLTFGGHVARVSTKEIRPFTFQAGRFPCRISSLVFPLDRTPSLIFRCQNLHDGLVPSSEMSNSFLIRSK